MRKLLVPARLLPSLALAMLACACAASPPSSALPPLTTATATTALLGAANEPPDATAPRPEPPVARKNPKVFTLHGQRRVDDYFWLREKDSPDVVSYLNAENAYTKAMTAPSEAFREALYGEMLGRIKETDLTVPVRRGDWLYYHRTEQGKQYPIHCRKRANDPRAEEAVLLDLNEYGKTTKYVGLGDFEVSDDGNILAYGIDTAGFRQFTMHVKDLRTGVEGPERIPRVDGIEFAKDNRTLLYVTEDERTKRSNQLHRHVLGEDVAKDALVLEEKDEMFDLEVDRSRSRDWIFVTSSSKTTSEVRTLSAARPTAEPRLIAPREHGHEYYVEHRGDLFYIRTNSGGKNFRVVTAPVSDPRRAKWKELVPHRPDVMLESLLTFASHYVLLEREDGLPRLRVSDFKTGASHRVEMPEADYTVSPQANPEFHSTLLRFNYQSLVTPPSIYDYETTTRQRTLLKQTEVLGGYDPASYESARLHAVARDGTKVPLSLVYKKGLTRGEPHPTLLYAYGSYGVSSPAHFSSDRATLLDRGVVFVVAHIRGGGEMGKKWHEDGRMMSKMHTFDDFIDSAEHLIKEKWTAPDRLVVTGASAGGLLMGAVANMRPELFKAIVAKVPFVDCINTMLDETLPLTVGEFEEWGNPKVKEQYDYIMQYSPYDNIAAKAYPAMLVETSYNDSQVMYWEPAKYVAKLRAKKTDANVLLLRINMEPAGHGGQSGRYDRLRETAFDDAFILGQLGITR